MAPTTNPSAYPSGEYKAAGVNESSQDPEDGSPVQDGYQDIWGDSKQDQRDMLRLGKKQEFKRNFHLFSALGFVSVYMATWEFVLVSLSVGFTNGGFGGLFWCFITTVTCYATIVASLAEMESMAPTSGGQYHWVSGTLWQESIPSPLLTSRRVRTSAISEDTFVRFRLDVNVRLAS